jgi:hypothetical protein
MHQRWLGLAAGLIGLLAPAPAWADVPTNLTRPTLSGNDVALRPGSVLTEVPGTWTGSPTSLTVQWRACEETHPGLACSDIPDATGPTYTIREADVGKSLTTRETAHNADGASAPAPNLWITSAVLPALPPAPVVTPTPTATAPGPAAPLPKAPATLTRPVLTGRAIVGRTLKTTAGTWDSTVPITVTYEWLICHGPCALIPGATGPTLQLLPAYAGNVVVARVTASNAGGRDYEYSNATFPIDFSVHDKLVQSLTLDGPQRRIGQLLKHHGYGMPFDAPHPGVVRVTWTRSVVRGGKRRSVLVAGGTELVTGSQVIRMELTPEGERLLKRASRLVITATARFSVGKRTTAKATERITLIR